MMYVRTLMGMTALLLSVGTALGQGALPVLPAPGQTIVPPTVDSGPGLPAPTPMPPPAQEQQQGGLSSWLVYPRSPSCCGPIGRDGPIYSEVYGRAGISIPLGSGAVNGQMKPGITIGTGARALFYNPAEVDAWVIDFGVSTVWLNSTTNDQYTLRNVERSIQINGQQLQFIVPELNITPDGVNQTYFNLSIGKEHYLWGAANLPGNRCRVGWDVGGRYGSCRFDILGDRHRTDTVGGFFIAGHSDIEIPWGCCIFQVGGRVEYGYVWSDVLQSHNNADLQTINVLLNMGVRF